MDIPKCPICERPMIFNADGDVGDPAYVCIHDDPAHGAERARVRAECEAILAALDPDRGAKARAERAEARRLGAECRPRGSK